MKIIVYYRVSTGKQQKSGLGIEAQKSSVEQYRLRTGATVLRSYTETESGSNDERPEFAKAVAHARRSRATLVVAKLDRLARDVGFLSQLQKTNLDFIALDCEHASKSMLQMMMVMAEWERDQIRQRTKSALAELKKQGVKLGQHSHKNPGKSRRRFLKLAVDGRAKGAASNKASADAAYADILPAMLDWRNDGDTLAEIAEKLNDEGHTTRLGKAWTPGTVLNVLNRA